MKKKLPLQLTSARNAEVTLRSMTMSQCQAVSLKGPSGAMPNSDLHGDLQPAVGLRPALPRHRCG